MKNSKNPNEEAVRVLNDLIETNLDRIKGYEKAAEDSDDTEIKNLCKKLNREFYDDFCVVTYVYKIFLLNCWSEWCVKNLLKEFIRKHLKEFPWEISTT